MLSEKAKELRREYYRKYRQENKERIKEYQVRYWTKKAKEQEETKKDA